MQIDSTEIRDLVLLNTGAKDGKLYYYDNIAAREGEVVGYWSASDQPGSMLWPPSADALGTEWGWVHKLEGLEVEVKR